MSNPTPGQWTVDLAGPGVRAAGGGLSMGSQWAIAHESNGSLIALVADGVGAVEARANAQLLAAAPDLLEALQPFANLLDEAMDERPDDWSVWSFNERTITFGDLRRAVAALTMARGEEVQS